MIGGSWLLLFMKVDLVLVVVLVKTIFIWIMTGVYKVQQYVASGEWSKQHLSFIKEGNRFWLIVLIPEDELPITWEAQ